MKKRSMLAVASLAAGVVTALVTPSSHAVVGDALGDPGSLVGGSDVVGSVLDGATGEESTDSTATQGGETAGR
ncbi:hypothetical protein [Streptomyces sp. TRM64462]|uniref:hypothetical protein n=1 Tax=Streptomyces sp. TRM64462 TaxID=2741726 RepID=UPI0015869710|nr:hypothetical protein [Streptomyces sp. TRM64462]